MPRTYETSTRSVLPVSLCVVQEAAGKEDPPLPIHEVDADPEWTSIERDVEFGLTPFKEDADARHFNAASLVDPVVVGRIYEEHR